MIKIHREDLNLAEGDVLVGPEVLVPVLRVLPQVSETFLQLGFVLGDVIHDGPEVGERVRWPDPVMRGAGFWSAGGSLQVQRNTGKKQASPAAGGDLKPKPSELCSSGALAWSCRTAVEAAGNAEPEASILRRPLLVLMPF